MSLGGNKLCGGCMTMSASWTGGTCSACMLRESNEEIARNQMEQMRDMQRQSQEQNTPYVYVSPEERAAQSRDEWGAFFVLVGILAAIATLVWSVSDDMTWWESFFYIFWYPIKMFFSLLFYIASFGHFNLF